MRLLQVRVKPNSREPGLEALADGTWIARVRSAPVEGKANDELVALVARHFGVRKAQVTIRGGATGRVKRIQVGD